ncbi:hypothetical protein B0H67DRAFT_68866 [Lasiosphaeris hirsuta]|uniref:Uncharacterized protein n=1 Tax=Lasiosphaeris hirsuta TaxID=260670 RepID=A0AA40BBP0_9PEZI|nr:hypothetical protein B0H67DRAFT_68866 [Lasiosphaeris hirsuta]
MGRWRAGTHGKHYAPRSPGRRTPWFCGVAIFAGGFCRLDDVRRQFSDREWQLNLAGGRFLGRRATEKVGSVPCTPKTTFRGQMTRNQATLFVQRPKVPTPTKASDSSRGNRSSLVHSGMAWTTRKEGLWFYRMKASSITPAEEGAVVCRPGWPESPRGGPRHLRHRGQAPDPKGYPAEVSNLPILTPVASIAASRFQHHDLFP